MGGVDFKRARDSTAGLLRSCREWPRNRAAEQRYELAPM
jgi:hypothetical protein